jgi:TonB family protein
MRRLPSIVLLILTSLSPLAWADPASAEPIEISQEVLINLAAHVAKFKAYPSDVYGVTGTVVVDFVLDSKGQLYRHWIVKSSCFPAMDQAALAMLERAVPFPPLALPFGHERAKFRVPVRFSKPKDMPAEKTPTKPSPECSLPEADS